MDIERIEAALRAGPADEPLYIPGAGRRERRQPLAFVLRGPMVAVAVIAGLVAGLALGLLRDPGSTNTGVTVQLAGNGIVVMESGEFWRDDTNPVLVALDPVTGESRELLECDQECSVWYDAWSPDGQSLLYANGGALYVYHATADRSRRLVGAEAGAGSWSPDGQQVLYESIGRPGGVPSDYYVIRKDGSGERRLNTISGNFTVWNEWTPDGRSIAFVVQSPYGLTEGSIALVDVASGTLTTLARFPVTSTCNDGYIPVPCQHAFAMSPVGERLIYATWDPEAAIDVLRTIDHEGRLTGSVPWEGSRIDWLSWSPDGSRLALTEGCRVWTMALDGSDQTLVHDFGECRSTDRVTWSPDGRELAVVVTLSEAQLASARLVVLNAEDGSIAAPTEIVDDTSAGPAPIGWQPVP